MATASSMMLRDPAEASRKSGVWGWQLSKLESCLLLAATLTACTDSFVATASDGYAEDAGSPNLASLDAEALCPVALRLRNVATQTLLGVEQVSGTSYQARLISADEPNRDEYTQLWVARQAGPTPPVTTLSVLLLRDRVLSRDLDLVPRSGSSPADTQWFLLRVRSDLDLAAYHLVAAPMNGELDWTKLLGDAQVGCDNFDPALAEFGALSAAVDGVHLEVRTLACALVFEQLWQIEVDPTDLCDFAL